MIQRDAGFDSCNSLPCPAPSCNAISSIIFAAQITQMRLNVNSANPETPLSSPASPTLSPSLSLSLSLSLYLSVCGCVCVYTTWSPSVVFLFYYNLLVHANEPPHICQRASSYMQRSLLIYANEPPHVRQRASAPICLLQDQAFPGFVQSFLKDMFPKSNGCRKH